jgi:hypothetical protein
MYRFVVPATLLLPAGTLSAGIKDLEILASCRMTSSR